ncbi:hypothetical protein RchiOBHm_Chr1g0353051 [Rosa chinensis]|uniref:Uncharacterized protein n=1 Tax=Rosa chinensis TaxID=74649 RepID=A0A2P6SGR0_ROSCH|nr:hypothetical protein RchiOBHm_Chr1g0353051 [Rosa chinensis]
MEINSVSPSRRRSLHVRPLYIKGVPVLIVHLTQLALYPKFRAFLEFA